MKQLFLVLLLFPCLLFAQENPKYLAGAVPVTDGKVVFTRTFSLPGESQQHLFQLALKWAQEQFTPQENFQSRILMSDEPSGQIVCLGQQYLVFSDKTLSLDRATIHYQMYLTCNRDKCEAKITGIRYTYMMGDREQVIPAEDLITDKQAINTKKGRLYKSTGKFRIHTIDLVEQLFTSLEKALGSYPTAMGKNPANLTADIPATGNTSLPGYKQISPDKIPGNIYKMLSENWMLVTAGKDNQYNTMTASWGGLGHLYNKPVTFCFINPTRHTYQFMENDDTYTLSFYTETYRDALQYCGTHSGKNEDKIKATGLTPITTPSGSKAFSEAWMIIECRKLVSQPFTPEAIHDPTSKKQWGNKDLHKMYIGEILNVWVK